MARKDYSRALLEFRNATAAQPRDAEPYYQAGLTYVQMGMASNAVDALRRATELNPGHSGAQLEMAELMIATQDRGLIERARSELDGLAAGAPLNAEVNDALAVAELKLGETDGAIHRLEQTLARAPGYVPSAINLAEVKWTQKDFNGAEAVLKKAASASPQSPDAAMALANLYAAAKHTDQAEAEIRRVLTSNPNYAPALAALGRMEAAGGLLAEADSTFAKLSALPDPQYRATHAMFLYASGEREKALAEFERLFKRDAQNRDLRRRLLSAYIEMGRPQQAERLVDAALATNGKDTDARLERAMLRLKAGKVRPAEDDLAAAIQFEPDSAQAHYTMAMAYRARGFAHGERQELDTAIRLRPDLLAARLRLAEILRESNEPRAAIDLLDHTPGAQRRIAAVVAERNWALIASGAIKDAESEVSRDLGATRLMEFVLQDAVLRLKRRDYQGARADAAEALASHPGDLRAVQMLLQTYVAQQQPQKALEALERLSEAQPGSAMLHYLLARWRLETGDVKGSRAALAQAKQADSKFTAADLAMADLDLRQRHDAAAATERLNAVLLSDPENVQARLALAALYEQSGDRGAAERNYRAVLERDAANLYALNNLAYQLAANNPDEALKLAQEAVEIAPDNPTVQDTLGWVYLQKGLYEPALKYFKAAFSTQATPRRQYHLGICYLKMGNREEGSRDLLQAIQKDPSLRAER